MSSYFRTRLVELQDRISAVREALDEADGFPAQAGRIDCQISEFFAEYVAWELDNPEIMKEALLANETMRDGDPGESAGRDLAQETPEQERRYLFHIDHELTSSFKLLDRALARLQMKVEWPDVPELRWHGVTFEDGYFRCGGRPVFTAGFNMLIQNMVDTTQYPDFAEAEEQRTRTFLEKMRSIGVGTMVVGVPVAGLFTRSGTIDTAQIEDVCETIRRYDQLGFIVNLMLRWHGDRESLEGLWPGITEYGGNGVPLDIDHPGTGELVRRAMSEILPAIKKQPRVMTWDMANEPFWDLSRWGPHTMRSYRTWLAEHYESVDALNAAWKSEYRGFDTIPIPKEKSGEECSAGEWFDRVTFHNFRVTSFFKLVADEIRTYVPDAEIHLKAQDNSSLGPRPAAVTDGIDREELTRVTNLHGTDTRPLPVTEPRMAAGGEVRDPVEVMNYDDAHYGFHWLGQSFLYDYLTSLEPAQSIVDFEYHAFSINAIRIPDIAETHPGAALWLAHLHGLVANMVWYWHRRHGPHPFPAWYFKMWLYGSISTQPLVAAEYFQTMLKLNTFANEIAALASVSHRPLRLLVSSSSYIQNRAHIHALHRVYEGSSFHGLRVGFVTEKMLTASGVPHECKVVVIPDVEYLSSSALEALKRSAENGTHLVRFGRRPVRFDSHGAEHPAESTRFLYTAPRLDYAPAPEVSHQFEDIVSSITSDIPVEVSVDGHSSFGVVSRSARAGGSLIVLLVNVRPANVAVQVKLKGANHVRGYDMLNCEAVDGEAVSLPFQGVRLIKVAE